MTSWFAAQSRLMSRDYPIGIGDDMAQIQLAGGVSVLITTDMFLEGTHFDLSKASIEQVGYKAMAANLSDCAAMATVPIAAVCSVGLPKGWGSDQLRALHLGITSIGDRFACPLIGGDITKWPNLSAGLAISISMLSRPINCRPVRRSGAKAGDRIVVTGFLGGSLSGRHLCFVPRVAEALAITQIAHINSMIDISDGLSSDLNHICRLSGVGAEVEASAIPLSDAARRQPDPLKSAIGDGEDFELLFTLADDQWKTLRSRWNHNTPLTCIGSVIDDKQLYLILPGGKKTKLIPSGYDHLAE